MKRSVSSNIALGLWLMLSPFVLVFINRHVFDIAWEDLILGFGIATFSLCRVLSRKRIEIALADGFVTALAFLTLANPFLYSYAGAPFAKWNNWIVGGAALILAICQDYRDETSFRLFHGPKPVTSR